MVDIEDNIDNSDSDDDLLGITDEPIDIRSMRHHTFLSKPHPTIGYPSTYQPKVFVTKNASNDNYRRNRKYKSDFNWSRPESRWNQSATSDPPTMEIIDDNNIKTELKQNRYQRMREISGIIGFIVNVHDATNFDIDLEMPPEFHEKYGDVISNQYTYQDLHSDFLENPDLNITTKIAPKVGTTYRCRLRGVGINQLSQHMHTWKSNQMCVEVKQLIDRTDGWIVCTLSDIDVYQRLLVDIIIYTGKGPINLRDYLLTRMEADDHREDPIFYPYSGKRERRPELCQSGSR